MSKINKTDGVIIFIFVLFVFVIRIINIDQKNLWFDEIFSWHLAKDNIHSLINRTSLDIHPPLYYLILKLWINITGDSAFAMRLLSTIFSSLSAIFIYLISKRLMDIGWVILVLILFILSPLNVFYSQEVRMASQNMFFCIASVYFFYLFVKNSQKNSYITIAYVIFTSAALYTHYFSFLIVFAEIIFMIFYFWKLHIKRFFIPAIVLFLIYLPWLPVMLKHVTTGQEWRSPQDPGSLINEYFNYIKDMNLGLYYHYVDPEVIKYLSLILLALFLIACVFIFIRNMKNDLSLLIIFVSLVPLILSGFIYLLQKIEFYRYLSILIPYLLILIVYGFSHIKAKVKYLLPIILSAINIYGLILLYNFDFKNNDYRGLVRDIITDYKTGDKIYTEPHYYAWIVDYYLMRNNTQIKTVNTDYGFYEILDSISIQKPERTWFILDYSVTDTTKYSEYKRKIFENYIPLHKWIYNLAPHKAELFLLKRKEEGDEKIHPLMNF